MATRNELEAVLEAAPLDDAGYLVFGDWLQAAGDPRGELIALDDGALRAPPHERPRWRERRRELLARHPELVPPVAGDLAYRWHLGFVRTLIVRAHATMPALAEVFRHPSLRFVAAVELDTYRAIEREILAELVATAPRSLRSLAIGRESYHWYDAGELDLDPLVTGLPQLEHLRVTVPSRFTQSPALRSLELLGIGPAVLEWLPRVQLPRLESLALHAGSRSPVIRWTELQRLVAAPLPALSSLALHHTTRGDEIVAGLASTPLLRQLRRLAMWNARLTSAGARHLTPDAFGHLELLDLSDAGMADEVARGLAHVCRDVRCIPARITASLRRPPSSART